jgi:type 1 fimbria pilin
MKRIALLISMLLLAASSALAIDGSVSIEGDVSRTHVAPDINIDVGQVFLKDFRVHSTSEFGKQYDEFTGSPNNYRVGLQYNGVSSTQFEMGTGYYNRAPYGYGKITYTFDTANH